MQQPITAAIVGVTGYEGANVARLLAGHPALHLVEVVARSAVGARLGAALPALAGTTVADLPITERVTSAELVFLAVPHGVAAELALTLASEGRRIIDISADFRLHDLATYAQWYGHPHPAPLLLREAVYGLPELHREAIRTAHIIGNPGCYPTAAILALAPAIAAGIIERDCIVDAKSAISGAGRSPTRRVHFNETADSVTAYALHGHRHLPEIEVELEALAAADAAPRITFVPHLVPLNRGLLATCYATLKPGVDPDAVVGVYQERYAQEPFVTLIDEPPETNWVRGSNRCLVHVSIDRRSARLIVVSAIDNLMKGGAGQAIQNANLCFNLPETTGLEMGGIWP